MSANVNSVNSICDRIEAAIHDSDDPVDIFNALAAVYTFHISLLTCPHCRKQAARALKQSIPDMLHRANAAAAQRASEGEPSTTCH